MGNPIYNADTANISSTQESPVHVSSSDEEYEQPTIASVTRYSVACYTRMRSSAVGITHLIYSACYEMRTWIGANYIDTTGYYDVAILLLCSHATCCAPELMQMACEESQLAAARAIREELVIGISERQDEEGIRNSLRELINVDLGFRPLHQENWIVDLRLHLSDPARFPFLDEAGGGGWGLPLNR